MKIKGIELPSLYKIKKRLKENNLNSNLNAISCINVVLEKPEGWIKKDIWGMSKYKEYLRNSTFFDYRVLGFTIEVISDKFEHYGKTIPL